MKLEKKLVLLLSGSSLLLANPTLAANIKSFDLTTWNAFGDVQVVDDPNLVYLSNNGLLNDDYGIGLDEDYNFSENPAVDNAFYDLETDLNLIEGALDLDIDNAEYAYEGSAIQQKINVQAGDKLDFEYNFMTNETLFLDSFLDYGFLLVNDEIIKLADFNNSTLASINYHSETGLQNFHYTFTSGGEYDIAFGVVDISDYSFSSALKISNITLTSNNNDIPKTPEPNSLLGLLFFGTFGFRRIRRHFQ